MEHNWAAKEPPRLGEAIIRLAPDGDLRVQYYPHKSRMNRIQLGDIILIINYLVYVAKSPKSKINKITFVKNEFMKGAWVYKNSFIQNRFKNEKKDNTPVSWDKLKESMAYMIKEEFKENIEGHWRFRSLYWETEKYNYVWKTIEELVEIIDSPIELRCIKDNDWTKSSTKDFFLDNHSIKWVLGIGGSRCWKEIAIKFCLANKDLPLLKVKKIWKKENLTSNNITHCLKGGSNNVEIYTQTLLDCCKDKSIHAPHSLRLQKPHPHGGMCLRHARDPKLCETDPSSHNYGMDMHEPLLEGSLKKWIEAMLISKYYIGADTGISHIAEMVNIPTLILYKNNWHRAFRGDYDEKENFHPNENSNQSWTNVYPNSKETMISCEDDLCPVIDKFESHLDKISLL